MEEYPTCNKCGEIHSKEISCNILRETLDRINGVPTCLVVSPVIYETFEEVLGEFKVEDAKRLALETGGKID